jgi:hypothetical protein
VSLAEVVVDVEPDIIAAIAGAARPCSAARTRVAQAFGAVVAALSATCAIVLREHAGADRVALGVVGVQQALGRVSSTTCASFHPRFTASWTPMLRPCPPTGECTCAASPASSTRPLR